MPHTLPLTATPEIDARHWLAAFGVAAALHAAVFLQWPANEQAGAEAPGVGGISVSIAMTASLAGAEQAAPDPALADQVPVEEAVTAERVAEPQPVEPAVAPESVEIPVEPVPVEPAITPEVEEAQVKEAQVQEVPLQEAAVEPVAKPSVAETVPIEEITPAEPVEDVPEAVTAVEPPPEQVPVAEPVTDALAEAYVEDITPPRPPIRPKAVEAKPVEPPVVPAPAVQTQWAEKAQVAPDQPVPATDPARQPVAPTATGSSMSAPAATVSSGQARNVPPGKATDVRNSNGGAAVSTPSPTYIAKLRLWLERHKDYPKMARRKRMQGMVLLYFRVGRDGEVLAQEIRDASGHALLDDAALEMLARATPLPEFPKDMTGDYLDVVLPVEYSLRGNR